jgi:Tol biopolymer transport system component
MKHKSLSSIGVVQLFTAVCVLAAGALPGNAVILQSAGVGQITFLTERDSNREIYSMNADGSAQTNLSHSLANEQAHAWSPDGTKIVFLRQNDNHLYVMNADGTGVAQVTADDFQHLQNTNLSWSPDGMRIAYIAGDDSAHSLSVINADGTGKRRLRETSSPFLDVVWSPDGTKIAYSDGASLNQSNLWVMNADGSGLTRITNHDENSGIYSRSPAWSPDSTRLVFKSNRDGNDEIYMVWVRLFYANLADNLVRLTTNAAADIDPAWSPDGTRIAFATNRDGNFEIYTMKWDDGGDLRRLTTNAAADTDPQWQTSGHSTFASEDTIQFARGTYRTFENPAAQGGVPLEIVITRLGTLSGSAVVDYETLAGTASERSDYTPLRGRLEFALGQAAVSFVVPVTYDSFLEGDETVTLRINFVGGGPNITLGTQRQTQITISDFYVGLPPANTIDLADNFVRQHYADFLNREPDASGLQFWSSQITACGTDAACIERKRADVSGAFFRSIEHQETGFYVYRLNVASFGIFPRFADYLGLAQRVGQGVVVGQTGWQQKLQENKERLLQEWAQSVAFIELCGGNRSSSEYVDILLANSHISATAEYRNSLIADLDAHRKTQADVLREIVEHTEFRRLETNRAFVLMQYFGYLRRNPDDPPDTNFDGYNFWLAKLDSFGGDFRRAEMVKAFINSTEYRKRFGTP